MVGSLVILSEREIDKMRAAGRLAAELVRHLGDMLRPGMTTQELNDEAERFTQSRGAVSAPLGYKDFPRSICTSLNEVVCHGIPSQTCTIKSGDIVSVDVTPKLDGFHGDTCMTFCVGEVDKEAQRLVDVTRECLDRGIAVVRPGGRVGDIGAAIQDYAEAQGFSVVRSFVGHGIGREFHVPPQVPHYRDRRGMKFRPGMAFTIEPMINAGTWEVEVLEDDWTAVTLDRGLSAQFEHTLVVTKDGVEVMTLPPA